MQRDEDNGEVDFETRQEQEAASEAGAIGGVRADVGGVDLDEVIDPAQRAVLEAGGGSSEGFELAERDLIRNASHDDGTAYPERDGFTVEREADRSTAEYGEADDEHSPDR